MAKKKFFKQALSLALSGVLAIPAFSVAVPYANVHVHAAEGDGEDEGEWEDDYDPDAYCAENGHSLSKIEKTENVSPCEDGYSQDCWQCDNCGRFFADENGETELQREEVVIEGNHDVDESNVKYAWVISSGNNGGSEEEGEEGEEGGEGASEEISDEDTVIDVDNPDTPIEFEEMPSQAISYGICKNCNQKIIIESYDSINGITIEGDDAEVEDCTKISGELTYNISAEFPDGPTLKGTVKKSANSEHDFQAISDEKIEGYPTCTEPVKYKAKCLYCQVVSDDITIDSENEDEQALGHDYSTGKYDPEAFAKNGGCLGAYYYAVCERCNETSDTEMVAVKTGSENAKHEGDVVLLDADGKVKAELEEKGIEVKGENEVKATCTSEGYSGDKVCDVCGEIVEKGEKTEKTAHVYTDKVDEAHKLAEANCQHGDLYPLICDNCGQPSTDEKNTKEVGEKLDHVTTKKQKGSLVSEATCSKPAVYHVKCDVCGEDLEETMEVGEPTSAHTYKKLIPSDEKKQEATCEQEEVSYVKCDNCDFVNKGLSITTKNKLEHDVKLVNQKDATCTEDGYTGDEVCQREGCGKVMKKGEVIKATGHQHTGLQNEKEATCTEDGYTGDTYCEDCETVIEKGEVIKAKNHDFSETGSLASEATCTEPEKHYAKCANCDEEDKENLIEVGEALGHQWDNGKVTKIATTSREGVRTFTCSRCKETKTEAIPKVAKVYVLHAKGQGGSKKVSMSWNSVNGAVRYQIYEGKCGNSMGSKPIATVTGNSYTRTSRKKGTCYKYYIVALNKDGSVIGKSYTIHMATKGGKMTNAKSVKVKKASVKVKKGKTYKMSNNITKAWKGTLVTHGGKFRYISSNKNVAYVKGGKIVGKNKGKATIRVMASNGVYKNISVIVK